MRLSSSPKRSALERAGLVVFATLIGSLVWLAHSGASKLASSLGNEAATVGESAEQKQKKDKKHKCPDCGPPGNQEIYVPLIDLPEAQGGEIVFNSRSPQAMEVTPVFYKRNGETVIADPVRIESAEIRYVKIMDLLPERYRHERNWGGFSRYSVDFDAWHLIRTANQTATSTATGRCTISKEGSVVISRELSDPDSEW